MTAKPRTSDEGADQFGKVPYTILGAGRGINAMLDHPRDALVYLALAIHLDGEDMTCHPRVETLAQITGISQRGIRRACKRLVKLGLVTVEGKGGRKRCNTYTLRTTKPEQQRENPDSHECPGIARKPGQLECPPFQRKPGQPEPKPGQIDPETRTAIGGRPTAEQRTAAEETPPRDGDAAAAGAGAQEPDPEVLRELDLAGIGDPNRRDLASHPKITAAIVRAARKPGLGLGGVLENIRTALRQLDAKANGQRRGSRTISVVERIRAENAAIVKPSPGELAAMAQAAGLPAIAGASPAGGSSRPHRMHGPVRPLSPTPLENTP